MGKLGVLFVLAMAGLAGFTGCSSEESAEHSDDEAELRSPDPNTAPKATEALRFRAACDPAESVTIAGVGDLLMHTPLQKQAYASPDGFKSTWKGAMSSLARADITYANLEGPTAPGVRANGTAAPDPGKRFDGVVYTTYSQFNYHPSLLDDLIASSVDVVSTANNHSLDRHSLGADKTLDELDRRNLPHTGTRRAGTEEPLYAFTEAKGFKIAWVACTFSTNGIPDRRDQVQLCFEGDQSGGKANPALLTTIRDLSQKSSVDAVIVTPHWGNEYEYKHREFQTKGARAFLEAGATAVFGGHPHVIQPWEKYETRDGRETFILYSFGNFAAGQLANKEGVPLLAQRTSLVLYLGLSRAPGKKAWVNGVKYAPLFMETEGGIHARVPKASEPAGSLAAKSFALSTRVFGEWDRIEDGEGPVKTNAECP